MICRRWYVCRAGTSASATEAVRRHHLQATRVPDGDVLRGTGRVEGSRKGDAHTVQSGEAGAYVC
jgi:hypothetical protein